MTAPLQEEHTNILTVAQEVLHQEAQGIQQQAARLSHSFVTTVQTLLACQGRVIVMGLGKSGHVGRKITATLASTGTQAFFVHPTESIHGDLGMICNQDVVLAISYSGEGPEFKVILPILRQQKTQVIALTGNPKSFLASNADICLDLSVEQEACPHNLAPTTSTTVTLAVGDAIAIALLNLRGFSKDDFARTHPGGQLGRRLLTRVRDVMHQGTCLPIVSAQSTILENLPLMTQARLGVLVVTDSQQSVIGIFTDGDLRRVLSQYPNLHHLQMHTIMTPKPQLSHPDALATKAAQEMKHQHINHLLIVDDQNRLQGILSIQDLLVAHLI